MATIFSAPTVGDPRATGIKNGGIKAFESDIVYPVSRLTNETSSTMMPARSATECLGPD
jgi:hypothetical protein